LGGCGWVAYRYFRASRPTPNADAGDHAPPCCAAGARTAGLRATTAPCPPGGGGGNHGWLPAICELQLATPGTDIRRAERHPSVRCHSSRGGRCAALQTRRFNIYRHASRPANHGSSIPTAPPQTARDGNSDTSARIASLPGACAYSVPLPFASSGLGVVARALQRRQGATMHPGSRGWPRGVTQRLTRRAQRRRSVPLRRCSCPQRASDRGCLDPWPTRSAPDISIPCATCAPLVAGAWRRASVQMSVFRHSH